MGGLTLSVVGSINVVFLPATAAAAGATWQLNNGPRRKSGEADLRVAPGSYSITCSDVPGYTTPRPIQKTVEPGNSVQVVRTYLPNPPIIKNRPSAMAVMGQPFSLQLTTTPAATSFQATGLPFGLGLYASSGLIAGSPTATGVYPITVKATNTAGTGSPLTLSLTVAPPGYLTVTTSGHGSVTKDFAGSTVQAAGVNLTLLATRPKTRSS